jgi:hypothetical protein
MPDAKAPTGRQTEQLADRDVDSAWLGFLGAIWILGAVVAFAVLFWTAVS